ncbi:MAG: DMT family transporter [Chlamydiae bacterium]|nr:DMT family transporter [Chlamydiota bacterium]
MTKEQFGKGVSCMLISATGLSILGLFGKLFEQIADLPSLVFFRFFSASICCLLFFFFIGHLKINYKNLVIVPNLIRSICVIGAQYCFYYYIQHASLMNGVALLNTGPLFIPFIEKLIIGSKIGRSTWISIIISFSGVLLILQPDVSVFAKLSLVGLAAGVFQAFSQVIFGINAKGENPEMSVLTTVFICSLISLIPFLIADGSFNPGFSSWGYGGFLILGLGIATILNQFARAKAYKFSTPSRLASFLYLSVVLAGIYDWTIFQVPPNMISCIGVGLVIFGGVAKIILRNRYIKAIEKNAPPI